MIKENSKAVTYAIPLHCHEDKNNGEMEIYQLTMNVCRCRNKTEDILCSIFQLKFFCVCKCISSFHVTGCVHVQNHDTKKLSCFPWLKNNSIEL